jgi:hypothetical protein
MALTSCLNGDEMNTPPGANSPFLLMTYVDLAHTGTTINSGLRYFGNAALTYPATHVADTATFAVSLQGVASLSKDVNVALKVDTDALSDYYSTDSLVYLAMPDSLYKFISAAGVIEAGKSYAEFKVIFYPSRIDPTKNFMLPVTATNDADIPSSSNYSHVYFHVIGNPIAGAYSWDFYRYNCETGAAGCAINTTFTGKGTVFAPVSPTSIKVPTGYYVQPNYLISFKNTGGVLSNFKAVIAPDEMDAAFTANGISVVSGPTIQVDTSDPAHPKYTIKYIVFNGTAFRNLTDVFTKR